MSTATDLNDAEQVAPDAQDTPDSTAAMHMSSLAVPKIKLDLTNNWTGVN